MTTELVADDTVKKAAEQVGGLARVWSVRFAALKALLDGMPDDVTGIVRLCDGTRDVGAVLAMSPLPPLVTLRVLHRLLRAGALTRADLIDDVTHSTDVDDSDGVDRRWLNRSQPPTPAPAPSTATAKPEPVVVPVVLETRSTVSGISALPAPAPKPGPELQAWLDDGDDLSSLFSPSQPPTAQLPWRTWQLVMLACAGAVAGALVASTCGWR